MWDLALRLSVDEVEHSDRWTVLAYNPRVHKSWKKMMQRIPDSLQRCLEDLCTQPMQRYPKRVFPLKGRSIQRSLGI